MLIISSLLIVTSVVAIIDYFCHCGNVSILTGWDVNQRRLDGKLECFLSVYSTIDTTNDLYTPFGVNFCLRNEFFLSEISSMSNLRLHFRSNPT